MVISDYGIGTSIKYMSTTSAACDTWVEYQTADCTTTGSMGRIICPTTARVRQKYTCATTATSIDYRCYNSTDCEWEVVEDGWGMTWEGTGASNYVINAVKWQSKPLTPEELAAQKERQLKLRFKQIIDGRCLPNIIIRQNDRRKALPMPADIREQRARETLKRVIGEKKFVGFLKSGFLSVKAKSGLVYQIFPGHGITCVFNQGQLVDRLCVVLQGGFPPTDSLIMRYLLILNNEQMFRGYAIKHHVGKAEVLKFGTADNRSLSEIFSELKKIA
jgi:hypothetical protein